MMKPPAGGSSVTPEKRLTARSNEPHQALTGEERPRYGARRAPSTSAACVAAAKYVSTCVGSYVACSVSSSSGVSHGVSCGVGLISTGPPSDRTAASTSRVTSATGRSGVSATRCTRPSLCSSTASWVCRSSVATSAPDPSGAGSADVSHPRALSRSAACWSCGSGGASSTASFPSTWVCIWSVSHVARQASRGSSGQLVATCSALNSSRDYSPPVAPRGGLVAIWRGSEPLRPARPLDLLDGQRELRPQASARLARAPRSAFALAQHVRDLDLLRECARVRAAGILTAVIGCVSDTLVTTDRTRTSPTRSAHTTKNSTSTAVTCGCSPTGP